jgi:hypothetical protein
MTALMLNWRQAYEAGVLTCGGKGYRLAKRHRYGFPMPDGGVVVVDVYRQPIIEIRQARGQQHLHQQGSSSRPLVRPLG